MHQSPSQNYINTKIGYLVTPCVPTAPYAFAYMSARVSGITFVSILQAIVTEHKTQ